MNRIPIFSGVTDEERQEMMCCGCTREKTYEKEQQIFCRGDITEEFGVVIEGCVHVETIDFWGNRMILHNIPKGHVFAETYALCGEPMELEVSAAENSTIIFINLRRLLSQENEGKSWYGKILKQMLHFSAQKNLNWADRMRCISSKSIRSRVMTYLSAEALRNKSDTITIPFDRQQMADYLNLERSALSKELSKMQRDGILTYQKNKFHLLKKGEGLY